MELMHYCRVRSRSLDGVFADFAFPFSNLVCIKHHLDTYNRPVLRTVYLIISVKTAKDHFHAFED